MRVDNPLTSQQIGSPTQAASQDSLHLGDNTGSIFSSTHTTSPEITGFLSQLAQISQLREEVVQSVSQRLASGQLLTPDATGQTVQAIQDAAGRGG